MSVRAPGIVRCAWFLREPGADDDGPGTRTVRRSGRWLNDCYLYEPVEGDGPFPTLLLVLPGPVMNWEIIPVPFAAQGFSVLACYPLRGTDIDDLLRVSPRVVWNVSKVRLAAECEYTAAGYGTPNSSNEGKVENPERIANTRLLLAAYHLF